jgi:hypothetical protein
MPSPVEERRDGNDPINPIKDAEAETKISDLIDSVCEASKVINTKIEESK